MVAENNKRLTAVVSGRVQRVGFRAFAETAARSLGVTGRVSNQSDGTVRVIAEGRPSALESLVERLHQGPAWSRVESVDVHWSEATNEFDAFSAG